MTLGYCQEGAADLLNILSSHILLLYQHVRVPLLPGMHNVMLRPIGIENDGRSEVEHWITAPDIEALAVATAVLDKVVIGDVVILVAF